MPGILLLVFVILLDSSVAHARLLREQPATNKRLEASYVGLESLRFLPPPTPICTHSESGETVTFDSTNECPNHVSAISKAKMNIRAPSDVDIVPSARTSTNDRTALSDIRDSNPNLKEETHKLE